MSENHFGINDLRDVIHHDGIIYIIGDLIAAGESGQIDVLIHQANCQSIMGSGIAGALANSYPEVPKVDRESIMLPMDKLGKFTKVQTSAGFFVYNVYGQFLPGADTRYSALRKGLICAARDARALKENVRIGLPLIGCGVGGGDWKVVSKIIKEVFDGMDSVVYVLNHKTFNEVVAK